MKRGGARGQIKLSFGMIFSIILIIIFLTFGFYAIRTFIGIQDSALTEKFISDLQSDVDRVWRSTQSSEQKEYKLPSKINAVCFSDFSISAKPENNDELLKELRREYTGYENMVFYPRGVSGTGSTEIKNIAIEDVTSGENPYCIDVSNGKIILRLVKDFGEARVTITR